jgi:hypothetical protein
MLIEIDRFVNWVRRRGFRNKSNNEESGAGRVAG